MGKKTRNALELIDRMVGDERELRWKVAKAHIDGDIAQVVFDLRTARGLDREEFARLTQTTATDIEDLEEADYEGDVLEILNRIAFELGLRVEIGLVPREMEGWNASEVQPEVDASVPT